MLILLADDHALVREGLRHSLGGLAPDLGFLEAASAAEVMGAIARHRDIDLILLDLVMPGSVGLELLARVCDSCPEMPVVVLSASSDPHTMRKALDIGAAGFIPKSAEAEVMRSALRLVLAGGIYVPPDMLRGGGVTTEDASLPGTPGAVPAATPPTGLTARQVEVLAGLCRGRSNKQIARELHLSENTVKVHVAAIFRALGVDNRTQAAMVAREYGISAAACDSEETPAPR